MGKVVCRLLETQPNFFEGIWRISVGAGNFSGVTGAGDAGLAC